MTNLARLFRNEMDPWDLMFRNFSETDTFFAPAMNIQAKYPVDIHEDENSVNIEIAVAGIEKEDIEIEEDKGVLRVSYAKNQEEDVTKRYIQRHIAKRSFNFGWRVSDRFDLKKIDATMDKGILKISIPRVEEKEIPKKTITIK